MPLFPTRENNSSMNLWKKIMKASASWQIPNWPSRGVICYVFFLITWRPRHNLKTSLSLHYGRPGHGEGSPNESPLPSKKVNTTHQSKWRLLCPLVKGQNKRDAGSAGEQGHRAPVVQNSRPSDHTVDCSQGLVFTDLLFPLEFEFTAAASALWNLI